MTPVVTLFVVGAEAVGWMTRNSSADNLGERYAEIPNTA